MSILTAFKVGFRNGFTGTKNTTTTKVFVTTPGGSTAIGSKPARVPVAVKIGHAFGVMFKALSDKQARHTAKVATTAALTAAVVTMIVFYPLQFLVWSIFVMFIAPPLAWFVGALYTGIYEAI